MTFTAFVRCLTLLALSVVASVVPAGAGSAMEAPEPFYCWDTCTETDPRGDAPARVDLLRARVSNAPEAFTVKFRVRDLPREGSFVLGAGLSGWGINYFVTKTRRSTVVKAQTVSEEEVYPKVTCRTATVRWNRSRDVVRARFPYACTGDSPDGGSIVNGLDFRLGTARDRMGKVFYRP